MRTPRLPQLSGCVTQKAWFHLTFAILEEHLNLNIADITTNVANTTIPDRSNLTENAKQNAFLKRSTLF